MVHPTRKVRARRAPQREVPLEEVLLSLVVVGDSGGQRRLRLMGRLAGYTGDHRSPRPAPCQMSQVTTYLERRGGVLVAGVLLQLPDVLCV